MALSPGEKQRRYRERQADRMRSSPDVIEGELMAKVERAERGELSDDERAALADKIGDIAMRHLRRAQELSAIARKLRPPGWLPHGAPP
jgi:hypothetical protein